MKNVLLLIAFLYSSLFIGQNSLLLPSENVIAAFEKQYPNKKPIWTLEYGKNDDVRFVAEFKAIDKTKQFAIYNSDGSFKSLKTQIQITKLPLKAQTYLKKNYPVKGKINPIGKIFAIIDDKNNETYIGEIKKDKKLYNVVFDKDGEFIKRIEIDNL